MRNKETVKRTVVLCLAGALILILTLIAACSGNEEEPYTTQAKKPSITTAQSAQDTTAAIPVATTPYVSEETPDSITPESTQQGGAIESTTPSTTTLPPEPEKPKHLTVSLSSTDIYTGSLIEVSSQNPYSYKVASLYTPPSLTNSHPLSFRSWVGHRFTRIKADCISCDRDFFI